MSYPNIKQSVIDLRTEVSTMKSNSGFRTNNIKFNVTENDVGEGRIIYDTSSEEMIVCCYSKDGTSASSVLKLRSSSATGTPNSFLLRAGDTTNYTQLFGTHDGTLTWGGIDVATRDIPTYVAAETLTAPTVSGKLCVVKASKDNAPNNGIILSTYTNASWWGQLFIGDNSTQGIYFRGMSDGVVGKWHRLLDENKTKAYITATYTSGTNWYRKYSDGWIEQGGQIGRQVTVTTNFNIAFTQIPTCICGCVYNRASTFYAREVYPNTVSTTAFTITNTVPAGATSDYIKWYACGY